MDITGNACLASDIVVAGPDKIARDARRHDSVSDGLHLFDHTEDSLRGTSRPNRRDNFRVAPNAVKPANFSFGADSPSFEAFGQASRLPTTDLLFSNHISNLPRSPREGSMCSRTSLDTSPTGQQGAADNSRRADSRLCSCKMLVLGAMRQFAQASQAADLPTLSTTTGQAAEQVLLEAIARNKRAMEAVSTTLGCHGAHDGHLFAVTSLVIFKTLETYESVSNSIYEDAEVPIEKHVARQIAQYILQDLPCVQLAIGRMSSGLEPASIQAPLNERQAVSPVDEDLVQPVSESMKVGLCADMAQLLKIVSRNVINGLQKI